MDRYHVYIGGKRTTVSVDNLLSSLLALYFKTEPGSDEAHSVIKNWFQELIDEDYDVNREHISQWLRYHSICQIADKKLFNELTQRLKKAK